MALRVEEAVGCWARGERRICGAVEGVLGGFGDRTRNQVGGRDAALKERDEGPAQTLMLFDVDGADADVIGNEPIWPGEEVVGYVTSGAYAHHVGKSLALGYVPSALANGANGRFEIEVLGVRRDAAWLPEPPFDPKAERMRM